MVFLCVHTDVAVRTSWHPKLAAIRSLVIITSAPDQMFTMQEEGLVVAASLVFCSWAFAISSGGGKGTGTCYHGNTGWSSGGLWLRVKV